jgi:hypothetical protein
VYLIGPEVVVGVDILALYVQSSLLQHPPHFELDSGAINQISSLIKCCECSSVDCSKVCKSVFLNCFTVVVARDENGPTSRGLKFVRCVRRKPYKMGLDCVAARKQGKQI